MKAEERKELEENTLARGLGTLVDRVKSGPSQHTIIILALVGVALLLVGALWYFWDRNDQADAQRWVDWYSIVDGEAMKESTKQLPKDQQPAKNLSLTPQQYRLVQLALLEKFAVDHPDTLQGRLAKFQQARLAFEEGMVNLGSIISHDQGLELIKKSEKIYSELADTVDDHPVLQQEALLNAGLARETLGNIEGSKEMLKRLTAEYPNSPAAQRAKAAIDRQKEMSVELTELVNEFSKASNLGS